MNTYNVNFWITTYGDVNVEAKTEKEASKRVYEILENDGLEGFDKNGLDYDTNDREYSTEDVEKV